MKHFWTIFLFYKSPRHSSKTLNGSPATAPYYCTLECHILWIFQNISITLCINFWVFSSLIKLPTTKLWQRLVVVGMTPLTLNKLYRVFQKIMLKRHFFCHIRYFCSQLLLEFKVSKSVSSMHVSKFQKVFMIAHKVLLNY